MQPSIDSLDASAVHIENRTQSYVDQHCGQIHIFLRCCLKEAAEQATLIASWAQQNPNHVFTVGVPSICGQDEISAHILEVASEEDREELMALNVGMVNLCRAGKNFCRVNKYLGVQLAERSTREPVYSMHPAKLLSSGRVPEVAREVVIFFANCLLVLNYSIEELKSWVQREWEAVPAAQKKSQGSMQVPLSQVKSFLLTQDQEALILQQGYFLMPEASIQARAHRMVTALAMGDPNPRVCPQTGYIKPEPISPISGCPPSKALETVSQSNSQGSTQHQVSANALSFSRKRPLLHEHSPQTSSPVSMAKSPRAEIHPPHLFSNPVMRSRGSPDSYVIDRAGYQRHMSPLAPPMHHGYSRMAAPVGPTGLSMTSMVPPTVSTGYYVSNHRTMCQSGPHSPMGREWQLVAEPLCSQTVEGCGVYHPYREADMYFNNNTVPAQVPNMRSYPAEEPVPRTGSVAYSGAYTLHSMDSDQELRDLFRSIDDNWDALLGHEVVFPTTVEASVHAHAQGTSTYQQGAEPDSPMLSASHQYFGP